MAIALLVVLVGCADTTDTAAPPAGANLGKTSSAVTTAPPTSSAARTTGRTTVPATTQPPRARRPPPVVVLDPGHNGANAAHPEAINRQVPAGRGRVKSCNTTGTSTDNGYPEHAFTFDVAKRVTSLLTAHGVLVESTRHSDDGVGPCVDERAARGNAAKAAAVVSIHADGAPTPSARGFHVAYSAPPLNAAQGEPALRLARTMRQAMLSAGFPTADYIGEDGLDGRDDLGGLNLSTRPAVLLECGNMRNPDEADVMTSPAGRQSYAAAIAAGILKYLAR